MSKLDLNSPFKLSAEQFDYKITIEKNYSDVTTSELFELFESLFLSLGFQPESFNREIIRLSEKIKNND